MTAVRIAHADHLVLTVTDIPTTLAWYERVLGMRPFVFADGRHALAFGRQKLNLHQAGRELRLRAAHPVPGSADVCLISATALADVRAHLHACGVPVEVGPVATSGATGPITSLYVRDPDHNLIEIATYDAGRPQAPDPYDLLPPAPTITLRSPEIGDGHPLPDGQLHPSAGGANHSPTLRWTGAPAETRGYAVTCFDPDAASGSGLWHWLLLDLPATCAGLPRDAGRADGEHLPPPAYHLRNDFGARAYHGAAAPPGDPAHRYVFAVHALDTDMLGLDPDASAGFAGLAVTAHTIGRGVLRPTHQRVE